MTKCCAVCGMQGHYSNDCPVHIRPILDHLNKKNAALRTRVEKLEAAWNAAVAFIDSHAADPDITQEMVENYQLYLEVKEALAEQEENNGNQ